MSRSTTTSIRSIAATAALAAAAALLLALLTGGGEAPRAAQSAPSQAERSAAAGRRLAVSKVPLLRRPRVPARDVLDPATPAGPLLADGALEVATVRRAPAGKRADYVAVSADGKGVCTIVDGGLGCTSLSSLLDEGTAPSIIGRAREPFVVFGVADVDVTDIELVQLDDSTDPVTITSGYYEITSDDWPQAMTWENSDGPQSYTFPDAPW